MRVDGEKAVSAQAAGESRPIDAAVRKQVAESFQRAKKAILNGDLSAFGAEFHSSTKGEGPQLALVFSELKAEKTVAAWELGELAWEGDAIVSKLRNAPSGNVAIYALDGATYKLAFLGKFSIF